MKILKHLPNCVLGLGLACLSISVLSALIRTRAAGGQERPDGALSQVVSKVKEIEVVRADVENETVIVEVLNDSEKAVVAIALEAGDDKDASGVSVHGFKSDGEPPVTIIKPHGTYTMRIPLSYVKNGAIKVGGVMYADGTEDGEKAALGTLRRQKEHAKRAKKEESPSRP